MLPATVSAHAIRFIPRNRQVWAAAEGTRYAHCFVMLDRKKGPRNDKDDRVGYRRQSQLHENLEEPAEEAPETIDKAVRFEEPEDPEAERRERGL